MLRIRWLAFLLAAAICAPVAAQQYPTKTVRMIVGFPPGGGTDIVTRLLAQKLTETWKQQFIVPGLARAWARSSAIVEGADGWTMRRFGLLANTEIGAKSRSASNVRFL